MPKGRTSANDRTGRGNRRADANTPKNPPKGRTSSTDKTSIGNRRI